MKVQELIDELQGIADKEANVYIRIGGLPLLDVGTITIDNDIVILSDYE